MKSVTLDKQTMHKKDEVMPKYAELIYNGFWYSKARFKLQKIVDTKKIKLMDQLNLSCIREMLQFYLDKVEAKHIL